MYSSSVLCRECCLVGIWSELLVLRKQGLFQLAKLGCTILCEILSLQQPGQNEEGIAEILQDTWQQQAKMWNMPKCLQWQYMSILRQSNWTLNVSVFYRVKGYSVVIKVISIAENFSSEDLGRNCFIYWHNYALQVLIKEKFIYRDFSNTNIK